MAKKADKAMKDRMDKMTPAQLKAHMKTMEKAHEQAHKAEKSKARPKKAAGY